MATDEFESFRGLPLTRAQDSEIRAYIARRQGNGEARDTLGSATCLKIRSPRRVRKMAAHCRSSLPRVARLGTTFAASVAAEKELVLCEVEIKGPVEYGDGKGAAPQLRVIAELEPMTTD